jgi:hypothetical protein
VFTNRGYTIAARIVLILMLTCATQLKKLTIRGGFVSFGLFVPGVEQGCS